MELTSSDACKVFFSVVLLCSLNVQLHLQNLVQIQKRQVLAVAFCWMRIEVVQFID